MSHEDPTPAAPSAESGTTSGSAADEAAQAHAAAEAVPAPAVETSIQVEVGLERSVRHLRIMLVFAALGAVVAAIAALMFPVAEGADYELGQAVGLMLVVGAVIGFALGALLSLILGLAAKRNRGAAIAVQTDVR